MKHVFGSGNPKAKLLIIGEAPGRNEEATGIPFSGDSGRLLDAMLQASGISRSEVFVDNVVTVRPPNNEIKRLKELDLKIADFYPRLFNVVKEINPNCILALGNTPLNALTGKTGIQKYRGSILWSAATATKVVSTIHPAYLLHSEGDEGGAFKYSARYYMQLDIIRAVTESKSKELSLPIRHIQIIKDSLQLHRFLQSYKDHEIFSLDIETRKSIPVCVGIAPTITSAASIQLMNIPEEKHQIPYKELAEMHVMLAKFFSEKRKWIGQNFKFDQQKLESVWGFHFSPIHADTMLMQKIVNPEFPAGLDFIASVYTREPYYKDEGKEFQYGKNKIEQLFNYNGKDVCTTLEAYYELEKELEEYGLKDFFYNYVMKLHDFYMDLEGEGILIDEGIWNGLITKYNADWKVSQARLDELVGFNVNVASPKQMGLLLYSTLSLPARGSTDEETIVALLGNHAKDERTREVLGLIIDIRRIRKTLGGYLSAYPDGDGRMRTSYRIIGTETGRSSTTKCDPPARPFKGLGLAFQTITKHGTIGADLRKAFIPDPGYAFVEIDLSQADARVVSLLSRDEETLRLFDESDIHTVTSSWIFNCKPIRDSDNVSEDKRFIGKTTRHAGNYGEGKRRLMLDCNAAARRFGINITLSEKQADGILKVFHGRTPKIRSIFHTEIQGALRANDYILKNPFGRRRQFCNRRDSDATFREAYAYIPSSTVRDQLSMAGLRIKDELHGIRVVVESHDAFVFLIKLNEIDLVAPVLKKHLEMPIDFSNCTLQRGTLVIPSEIKVGYKNYKELEDYKFA